MCTSFCGEGCVFKSPFCSCVYVRIFCCVRIQAFHPFTLGESSDFAAEREDDLRFTGTRVRAHVFTYMPSRTEKCVRVHITKALLDTLFTVPDTKKHVRMHACAHADTNARVRTHRCVRVYMIESLHNITLFLQSIKQGPSFQSRWEATQQSSLADMRTFDHPSCQKFRRRYERNDPALPLTKKMTPIGGLEKSSCEVMRRTSIRLLLSQIVVRHPYGHPSFFHNLDGGPFHPCGGFLPVLLLK